jgi:hypothetical protein
MAALFFGEVGQEGTAPNLVYCIDETACLPVVQMHIPIVKLSPKVWYILTFSNIVGFVE